MATLDMAAGKRAKPKAVESARPTTHVKKSGPKRRVAAGRRPAGLVPLPRPRPVETATRPSSEPTAAPPSRLPTTDVGRLIAKLQAGKADLPRVELAARLAAAGLAATDEYKLMRENAARELTGRPDGAGDVSADDLQKADAAIMRQIVMFRATAP